MDPNDAVGKSASGEKLVDDPEEEGRVVKSLMCQMSEKFYNFGWKPGTGGGMSIRIGEGTPTSPFRVFCTPSGIQKEDMVGDDLFELDMNQILITPPKTPGLQPSSMTELWFVVYRLRPEARCVVHTHSINSMLATLLVEENGDNVFRITHQEMIKGVGNHAYHDMLEIPVIDNQSSESKLAPDLEEAIRNYPKCNAVLVRRHGVYVWGESWEQAKTQLESFHYLFDVAVRMKNMGLDCAAIPSSNLRKKRKLVDEGEEKKMEEIHSRKKPMTKK